MKYILSVALLLLINSSLIAQFKLTGTVNDNQKLPLPYSGLTLSNLSGHQTTTTDSTGYFSFKNLKPGKYQLTTSYTGFQKISVDLVILADTSIKIVLQSSNNQLSEVTVTAGKTTLVNNTEKLTYLQCFKTALPRPEPMD
ncbi:carboxypeptidase regulatory-like domain-containing protein [Pedobacter sp. NJ-S-72]